MIHPNEEGAAVLGKAVADIIKAQQAMNLKTTNYCTDKVQKEYIKMDEHLIQ